MSHRTLFLARLIGLYCLLAAAMMLVQRDAMVASVTALVHEGPLLLLLGLVTVAAGLAMILCHNLWSGGTLPVVVTLIGWLTLIKGLMFWLLPPAIAADFYLQRLHYVRLFYLYLAVTLLIGAYLTVAGFRPMRRPA
jgi:hypothetical protein